MELSIIYEHRDSNLNRAASAVSQMVHTNLSRAECALPSRLRTRQDTTLYQLQHQMKWNVINQVICTEGCEEPSSSGLVTTSPG
jgi:hypothetical protein